MEKKTCDVLVIGGGPGGYVAAIRLGQLGKRVIIVEKEWIGGTCLNIGCIPSKALIYAADFYNRMKTSSQMGIETPSVSLNMEKLQEWKDGVVKKLRTGTEYLLKTNHVEIIMGTASLFSSRSAKVASQSGEVEIGFDKAILATGSKTIQVPGLEFDGDKIISSNDALVLKQVPKNVLVVGGGYIGIEIGTFFAKVGSEVVIAEKMPDILMQTDRDVVEVVKKRKMELGVKVMPNTSVVSLEKRADGLSVKLRDASSGQETTLSVDKLFVAVGRKPNTEGLGLENTKVERDERGFVKVNDSFETAEPNIYAVGDLIGNPMLAHKGFMEGKMCAEVIAGGQSKRSEIIIPAVIFSDPEIAMVGLSENDAQKQGISVTVSRFPFSALGRAFTMNSTQGFVKVVADAHTKKILGFHIVGPEASNLIGESALALNLRAELEDISRTVHPHPTLSEALGEAADLMLGKCVHFIDKKK
jgi:dihydrolipoamide dehydrogenase